MGSFRRGLTMMGMGGKAKGRMISAKVAVVLLVAGGLAACSGPSSGEAASGPGGSARLSAAGTAERPIEPAVSVGRTAVAMKARPAVLESTALDPVIPGADAQGGEGDGADVQMAAAGNRNTSRLADMTLSRCDAAIGQANEAVHRYRSLSRQEILRRTWAEEALRTSEMAQRACDTFPEQAGNALILRVAALYLHGQYSRAAIYLDQIPNRALPAPMPQAGTVSTALVLRQCQTRSFDLDDLRLGILLQQAGYTADAWDHLKRASRSPCQPLAKLAEALRRG